MRGEEQESNRRGEEHERKWHSWHTSLVPRPLLIFLHECEIQAYTHTSAMQSHKYESGLGMGTGIRLLVKFLTTVKSVSSRASKFKIGVPG